MYHEIGTLWNLTWIKHRQSQLRKWPRAMEDLIDQRAAAPGASLSTLP